eukprot:3937984-Rhodomonas_salina.1
MSPPAVPDYCQHATPASNRTVNLRAVRFQKKRCTGEVVPGLFGASDGPQQRFKLPAEGREMSRQQCFSWLAQLLPKWHIRIRGSTLEQSELGTEGLKSPYRPIPRAAKFTVLGQFRAECLNPDHNLERRRQIAVVACPTIQTVFWCWWFIFIACCVVCCRAA